MRQEWRKVSYHQDGSIHAATVDIYEEWRTWINSFHIYSHGTEMEKRTDSVQTAKILRCLGLSMQKFTKTCLTRKILSRSQKRRWYSYKFRSRKKNNDEPIDVYLSSLRELAKACEFGEFENEMINELKSGTQPL